MTAVRRLTVSPRSYKQLVTQERASSEEDLKTKFLQWEKSLKEFEEKGGDMQEDAKIVGLKQWISEIILANRFRGIKYKSFAQPREDLTSIWPIDHRPEKEKTKCHGLGRSN
jgi:hypothetical protein